MTKKKVMVKESKLGIILISIFVLLSLYYFSSNLTGLLISGCTDSDNGDKYIKGTLNYQGLTVEDDCMEDNVVEYFCNSNGIPSVKLSKCESKCQQGACISTGIKTSFKESFQIQQGSDFLEVNEYIGDVIDAITELEMPSLLKSSRININTGITSYKQYLRFNDTNMQTGKVKFDEDEENEVSDFLFFDDKDYLFEYEIDFENNLVSDITNNKLKDLNNKKIIILGDEYEILDSNVNNNEISLTFLGGKSKDTLKEGDSKIYTQDGKDYVIKLLSAENNEAIFSVNNIRSSNLEEGETDLLNDTFISLSDVLESETGDLAVFYFGSRIFKIKDTINDDSFKQGIEINGKLISDAEVKIKGEKTLTQVKINNIKYRAKAKSIKGSDIFVSPGSSIKKSIKNPELFLGTWDILYNGLDSKADLKSSVLIFNPTGSKYRLTFTNQKGRTYTIPLISNNGGTLTLGNDEDSLYFIEASSSSNYIINIQDYFVLTSKNDRAGITNILRYRSISPDTNQISFVDLSEGGKEVIFSGTLGTNAVANLVVSGKTYKVYIGSAPDYKLAIDLNGNGNINSEEVNIVSNGGGRLDLGSAQTSANNFNMTLITDSSSFGKRRTNENINIEMQKESGEVNVALPSQSDLTLESTSGGNTEGLSSFGINFRLTEKSGPDKLLIEYTGSQAKANVTVVLY